MKKYLSLSFLLLVFLGLSCSPSNPNSDSQETAVVKEEKEEKKEKEEIWKIKKVVDEFGDEVKGERAVIGIFNGRMSNSATTNSDIKVKVQIGKDKNSYITFIESSNRIGNLPNKKLFKIKIKKEDDSTEFIDQFSMNNMMVDTKGLLIEKVLSQDSPLKINVDLKRASKYKKTVYNFEISPKGLKEILEK